MSTTSRAYTGFRLIYIYVFICLFQLIELKSINTTNLHDKQYQQFDRKLPLQYKQHRRHSLHRAQQQNCESWRQQQVIQVALISL